MLGPFATASRFTLSFTRGRYCRHCRTPPAHRCPRRRRRRQRQRVTEGTAMAPWNGPNEAQQCLRVLNASRREDATHEVRDAVEDGHEAVEAVLAAYWTSRQRLGAGDRIATSSTGQSWNGSARTCHRPPVSRQPGRHYYDAPGLRQRVPAAAAAAGAPPQQPPNPDGRLAVEIKSVDGFEEFGGENSVGRSAGVATAAVKRVGRRCVRQSSMSASHWEWPPAGRQGVREGGRADTPGWSPHHRTPPPAARTSDVLTHTDHVRSYRPASIHCLVPSS